MLGIDIGGTKISAAVVDTDGRLLTEPVITPTPAADGAEAILRAALGVALIARERCGVEARSAGVGSAGVIDGKGVVISATDVLPGWTGTPLAARLSEGLGLPVTALNDVHAAAVGEARAGAAAGYRRVLVVTVGTGIGGAFLSNNELDLGPGRIAGSIGHLPITRCEVRTCSCGVGGHAEAYASGPAIERAYREMVGNTLGLRQIARLRKQGDPAATHVIDQGAAALGEALAAAANLLDPDCIVIGGGVAQLGAALFDGASRAYRSTVLPPARGVPITRAALGPVATIVGAALSSTKHAGVIPTTAG